VRKFYHVMRFKNDVIFIRDGFSVLAFAFPLVWLLWHRLFLQSALYFAFIGTVAALSFHYQLPIFMGLLLFLKSLAGLLIALEGSLWHKTALEAKGYTLVDFIIAHTVASAEEVFASRFVFEGAKINEKSPHLTPSLFGLFSFGKGA
jgi:Protein of unknown function (DUF2628)